MGEMSENFPEISRLLTNERDLSRLLGRRIFAYTLRFRWVPLIYLAAAVGGGYGVLAQPGLTPYAILLCFLALTAGVSGLAAWGVEWRLRKIAEALAKFPVTEVDAVRERFARGGAVSLEDWFGLAAAIVIAAIMGKIAIDFVSAGDFVSAAIATFFGLVALISFRWKVRGWKRK